MNSLDDDFTVFYRVDKIVHQLLVVQRSNLCFILPRDIFTAKFDKVLDPLSAVLIVDNCPAI